MVVVAIEFSDREARCLWLEHKWGSGLNDLGEVDFDRIPIPTGVILHGVIQDVDVLSTVLEKARIARKGHVGTRVFLALPWALGIIRTHRLPWFPPSRRVQALHYVIEEDTPIPEGNVAYAYQIVAEKKRSFLEVVAGAVRRSTLDGYVAAFKQAGFQLERVELAVTALTGLLPLQEGEDGLCLYPDQQGVSIALFHGLKPTVVRTFTGGSVGGAYVEFERLILYLTAQHPEFSLRQVWCLGLDQSEEVDEILEHIGVTISREGVALVEVKAEAAFRFAPVAFALAWQVLKRQQGMNLWPVAVVSRRKRRQKLGIGLALSVSVILGSLVWLPWQKEISALGQETAQLRLDGAKHVEERNRETALLSRWHEIGTTSVKVGELLAQIETQGVPGMVLESLEFKQGLLYLRASAREARQVEGLLRELMQLGWEKPTLTAYSQEGNSDIVFALTARRSSQTPSTKR